MAAGINWTSDMQSGEAQINNAISTAPVSDSLSLRLGKSLFLNLAGDGNS